MLPASLRAGTITETRDSFGCARSATGTRDDEARQRKVSEAPESHEDLIAEWCDPRERQWAQNLRPRTHDMKAAEVQKVHYVWDRQPVLLQ